MKQFLNEQERIRLDERIAATEKKTGAQIVLAVIERSDSYPELPWKAFAVGSAISGFAACLLDLLQPVWTSASAVLFTVVAMLASGAAAALICVLIPKFACLFLDTNRAEMEVRQYAESLFLSREVFATCKRTGIVLLVSLFERRVVVVPDSGLRDRLSSDALQKVINDMTATLASGPVVAALDAGLGSLEQVLGAPAEGQAGKNELPDAIVQEKGI